MATSVALTEACTHGHLALAKWLVKSKADVDPSSALSGPVSKGHRRTVAWLLAEGADLNVHHVVSAIECKKSLMTWDLLSRRPEFRNLGLVAAAKEGANGMIQRLLRAGADASAFQVRFENPKPKDPQTLTPQISTQSFLSPEPPPALKLEYSIRNSSRTAKPH